MPDNELEEIKRRIDIVEFIGSYVTLKKSGANYKGLCPFHSEKTPSFMVSAEKQIFKCFGCNSGGDVFSFLMKVEGLGFGDALKTLAEKAGVKLARDHFNKLSPGEQPGQKSRLYDLNDLAARLYHKILLDHPAGKPALKYLTDRGITAETIDLFNLGFAPKSWDLLIRFGEKHGFSEKELILAGLAVRKENQTSYNQSQRQSYDRFRQRITFPVNNVLGSTVAFTGRLLTDEKDSPKYLNSSESPIYSKSAIIYGLDKAKMAIKQADLAIVVEGNMDVIACHQAGFINVVAVSGTALSREMLMILSRYTYNLAYCFDSDSAGEMAKKRAIGMSGELDLNSKIITLPKGFKDPDEAIKADRENWRQAIKSATPAIEHLIDQAISENAGIADKKKILKEILPLIKILKSQSEQEHYLKLLATKLLITEQVLREEMKRVKSDEKKQDQSEERKDQIKISPEVKLLAVASQFPELINTQTIKAFKLIKAPAALEKVIEKITTGNLSPEEIKKLFSELSSDSQLKQIWLSVSNEAGDDQELVKAYLNDLAKKIINQEYEERKNQLVVKISEADEKGDPKEKLALLKELNSVILDKDR